MATKGWKLVHDISILRHGTRRGHEHLSEHGQEVLEYFLEADQKDLLTAALTGNFAIDRD